MGAALLSDKRMTTVILRRNIRAMIPAIIQKMRTLIIDIVQKYTCEVRKQAAQEIESLSDKMFLPASGKEPDVFIHIGRHQIHIVVKYFTDRRRRSEIRNRIVEEISRLIPGITDVDQ